MLKLYLFFLKGYFCPTGTTNPQPCPNGYYGNSTLVKRSEDCVPCPAGEFCAGFGLRMPTGLCDAGFYCRGKAFTSVILIFDFLSCPGLVVAYLFCSMPMCRIALCCAMLHTSIVLCSIFLCYVVNVLCFLLLSICGVSLCYQFVVFRRVADVFCFRCVVLLCAVV